MFRDRKDAARRLLRLLSKRAWHNPLVLGIPRGGVVVGAVLARGLNAELDVVLARKLRAPGQPELALGAVAEDGEVYLNHHAQDILDLMPDDLAEERRHQLQEIARRKALFRRVRPQATIADRSIIVTDDGIATGSTMIAALHWLKTQKPREIVVAVPVASPERIEQVRRECAEVICLDAPEDFWAIGQFYEDFHQIEDEEVVALLREQAAAIEERETIKTGS